MRYGTCGRLALSLLMLALAGTGGASAIGGPAANPTLTARADGGSATTDATADPQSKGRYKKQGDSCVWDAEDNGPNQCTPVTPGRFKKNGDSCVWDASDKGPDQCQPPAGRFKKDGSRCVWDASDSGPNQCNPKQPR